MKQEWTDVPAGPAAATAKPGKIDRKLIEKVEVTLEAYLGHARVTVGQLEALGDGAVVPLEAALNQAVELRLNGIAVATGELVAVGDKFAVRLIELVR
jgi:flagellar motor switch protein FliN/FliY